MGIDQPDLFDVGERVPQPGQFGWKNRRKSFCVPAPIGSGPAGETCGTCRHKMTQGGTAGRYLKCGLMIRSWSRGGSTDIKAKWAACEKWEPKNERPTP